MSEDVSTLPTREHEADARLEALLIESLTTGGEVEADATFWGELRAEASRRAAVRKRT